MINGYQTFAGGCRLNFHVQEFQVLGREAGVLSLLQNTCNYLRANMALIRERLNIH
jgi:hypothetical protein